MLLPKQAADAMAKAGAPPRLLKHLEVVHHVAMELGQQFNDEWDLGLDLEEVALGASIHDIGKIACPEELTEGGRRHESVGPGLAEQAGFSPEIARHAQLHAKWSKHCPTEVLVVALADSVWKGKRDAPTYPGLEDLLLERISATTLRDRWEVYSKLDDIITRVASSSDDWLEYCK